MYNNYGDNMQLESIKEKALEKKVPIIQDASLDKIIELIKNHHIQKVLEIGTAVGYSASAFVLLGGVSYVLSIERNIDMYNEAISNIQDLGLTDNIQVLFGDALDIELESKNMKSFDLLFIDAAKAQSQKFFERYSPFVKDEGIIIVDNILFHGVKPDDLGISKNLKHLVLKIEQFVEWLKKHDEYETVFFMEGDGLAISTKKK